MNELQTNEGPSWDEAMSLTLTPGMIINALFYTANSVHSGWESCVVSELVVNDLVTMDERTGNYCRLVEQEFVEDGNDDEIWRDWAVEVRIGPVWVTGHWQVRQNAQAMEWDWTASQAEQAFDRACVLFGKRVRRGMVVEEPRPEAAPPPPRHH